MNHIDHFISASLKQRQDDHALRSLKPDNSLIDFCSNDYLGFSRSERLRQLFERELRNFPQYRLGSGGSRLLAGNDNFAEQLENEIAAFHGSEAALLYNSGYDANMGLFSSLPQRGDTVICDEYAHASIIDGIRLSHATRFIFKHNDPGSLEQKLKRAKGKIFIAVESIYSMDGDEAPLQDISRLAEQYSAALIVDEAHAVGVFGDQGKGLVHEKGLTDKVFARVVTFGKALGTHGAAVLCSSELRTFLINFSRSFIYTTAPSFLSNLAIRTAYSFLKEADHQSPLHQRICQFRSLLDPDQLTTKSRSGIQTLIIPGNSRVKEIALRIQQEGFDIRAILSPTVPSGSERLRICIHNHNTIPEIRDLCNYINQLK